MLYEEFKSIDTIGAYLEYTSVQEAKDFESIPREYHDIIPSKCICGSDMIINSEKTTLTCCDIRCYIRMGHCLEDMLKKFDCKGLGPATCVSIVKHAVRNNIFKIPSYIEILHCYEEFEGLLGAKYLDLRDAVYKIHCTPLKFYQMIQYLEIPGFDTSCRDLFGDIINFNDLMSALNKDGIMHFLKSRGIADLKKSINLNLYLRDIRAFEGLYLGNFTKPALKNLRICITGPVSPKGVYMSRKEFLSYCNSISHVEGSPLYDVSDSTAINSVMYVIADSPYPSSKYLTASNREKLNPGTKIIYSSTEFVELIEGEVEKCKMTIESKRIR